MNTKRFLQVIQSRLEESKGYFLYPSLLAASIILLILTPKNGWSWGLFVLLVVRIIRLQHPSILKVSMGIAVVTALWSSFQVSSNKSILEEEMVLGMVQIHPDEIKIDGDRLSGTGWLLHENKKEKIAFFYTLANEREKSQFDNLVNGIHIEASFKLFEPEKARNLHQFDYHDYLHQQRIHWTMKIQTIHSFAPANGMLNQLRNFRFSSLKKIEAHMIPGKIKEYALAMILNQKSVLPTELMDHYRKIGIIHLFSISGLHIHFLMQSLRYLLLRLGITKETTRYFLLTVIVLYGLLIGGGVGVFRAVFTHSLLLIAQILGVRLPVKDAFSLSFLVALWRNPYLLFQLGFQLSYSLAGVLYFLSTSLNKKKYPLLFQIILLPTLMAVVSFPYLSFHFFEVTWLGIFANLIFAGIFSSFFFPVFWFAVLWAMVRLPLEWLAGPERILSFFLLQIEKITEFLAEQHWLRMITGRQALFWYVVIAVVILCFLRAFEEQKQLKKWGIILVAAVLCFYSLPMWNPQGKVVQLDVGQGDAVLFIAPRQEKVVLLDTGGLTSWEGREEWQLRSNQDQHAKNVVSALKSEGIRKLDALIVTHSDYDHIGNMGHIANELPVRNLYFSAGMEDTTEFQEQFMQIRKQEINVYPLTGPTTIDLSPLQFHVLHPTRRGTGRNEDSLVLATRLGGYTWLFTGDLDQNGERALIQDYPLLKIDFLKVGHHGSATSTSEELLAHIQPKAAFISSGKNNHYGHPHPDVLHRLKAQGVQIYRTDLQGAIHFFYDEKEQSIQNVLQ